MKQSAFQEFVGYREGSMGSSDIIPSSVAKQERISGDLAMEIGKLSFQYSILTD